MPNVEVDFLRSFVKIEDINDVNNDPIKKDAVSTLKSLRVQGNNSKGQ